jgi:hypothetical protein
MALAAALPAATALAYAGYALVPERYPESFRLWAALLLVAEMPLCLLGAVFAGAAAIPGTARRVGVYLVVVALLVGAGGLWELLEDDQMGPLLAWAALGHVVGLLWLGPDAELAVARADAIATDAATLVPLTGWLLVISAVAILVWAWASDIPAERAPWGQLAWVGALHFALRAWSGAFAHGAAFAASRRGLLDRPWIDRLLHHLGRSPRNHESDTD